MQRARLLNAAVAVLAEEGYWGMSVARVTRRARVSRRTFYDVFESREDCFLAAFDRAVERVEDLVVEAYEGAETDGGWQARVRAGLLALLVFLDEERGLGSLLVVDALTAGPVVLQRRAEVLGRIGAALDRTGNTSNGKRELSELTGEGVVGAVFSVVHTRLSGEVPGSLVGLLNPLMGVIVLPYLGSGGAQKELERPAPKRARISSASTVARQRGSGRRRVSSRDARPVPRERARDPLVDLPMRLMYRTMRVLGVIGEQPGLSNRVIGENAGASDQGQISKLLQRLEKLGLIENTTAHAHQPTGEPNAWRLTVRGEEAERATQINPANGRGGVGS
jgi:AcrR family transcriptional regulator